MFHFFPGLCSKTLTGHTDYVMALALLPNSWLASGSGDTKIMVWDITKTSPLYTLIGRTSWIRGLVVIHDEFLAACSHDMTIRIWSLRNFTEVKSWQASNDYVISLAFDTHLNLLASGDMSELVKVWDSNLWNTGK